MSTKHRDPQTDQTSAIQMRLRNMGTSMRDIALHRARRDCEVHVLLALEEAVRVKDV